MELQRYQYIIVVSSRLKAGKVLLTFQFRVKSRSREIAAFAFLEFEPLVSFCGGCYKYKRP